MNAEAQTQDVQANFDNTVDVKEYKFHFKTTKDKESGIENKRPTVELKLPIPSVEGLVNILKAGGKQLDLLLSAAESIVVSQARSILNDNDGMTDKDFPMDQCGWEFIANMPDAEKRGRGIPKEVWEDFATDYIAVMPGVTGKTVEQVTLAAQLFLGKFQKVKTNKPVITKLREQLAVYFNNSSQAEQFTDCVKFLEEKAETLLQADETALLANL